MKKFFTLIILCVFSIGTIYAEITWSLSNDGTLTISGTGDMESSPWYSQRDKIKKVVIENGVTSIGGGAFSGCSGLTSVTIGNSVKSIGENAFDWWNMMGAILDIMFSGSSGSSSFWDSLCSFTS